MPQVPSTSPATGLPVSSSYIHTTALNFVDNHGRTLLLRGVNLSGASKAPVGRPSQRLEDFWESAERDGREEKLSFVGRPLNLEDGTADVHLARLRGWGFNMLRLPFTWEAVEHEGPGIYDYDYMDYVVRVLCKCRDYGFRVYMDPHQDTWSRFSGGSGAPFWTLAACGINPHNITATQAAILHSEYVPPGTTPPGPDDPLPQPSPASLPAMIWSTNYGRLLSQTLFTFFFSGSVFAPRCIIDGVNIQDYLQSHFISACGALCDRIAAFEGGSLLDTCVIGWDSMNEPFEGLVGWDDLGRNPEKQGSTLKKGTFPTPIQSMRLGMGLKQRVDNWTFGAMGPKRDGSVDVDPKGRTLWVSEPNELPSGYHPIYKWTRGASWPLGVCPWALHGVWDLPTSTLLLPAYFAFNPSTGASVEFLTDFWKPHWLAYASRIRASHPEAMVFVQPPVFAQPPPFTEEELRGRTVYAPHYYDGLTLVTRHWNWFNADALGLLRGKYGSALSAVKIGENAIRKSLWEQMGYLLGDVAVLGVDDVEEGEAEVWRGKYPTLIGEIGTPFDMDKKRSYGWTDGGRYKGDYSRQEHALDASLQACDARIAGSLGRGKDKGEDVGVGSLSWTVWTYVPDDHTHEWGDAWNMEDLSLWSRDDVLSDDVQEDEDEDGENVEEEEQGEEAQHSRAGLLIDQKRKPNKTRTKKQPARRPSMHTDAGMSSALSLDTLGGAAASSISLPSSTSSASSSTLPPSALKLAGYSPNPYILLTNGARGVRAFSRAWPTKVVGRAVDVSFDIPTGVFRMVVWVGWEDRVSGGDEEERIGTEIYLPLVHYAHPRLLEGGAGAWDEEEKKSREEAKGKSVDVDVEVHSVHDADERRSLHSGSTAVEGEDADACAASSSSSSSTLPVPSSPSTAPLLIKDTTPDLIDIDVTHISPGTSWAVHGQTLVWWYDAPQTREEGRREYVIEVRRKGGVMPPPPTKTKTKTKTKERTKTKGRRREERDGEGWFDQLACCEGLGCVVM